MNKIAAISDLKKNFIDQVFELTTEISANWPKIEKVGNGKTICLLFWEPSTRTKLSFEHAAKMLGFNVLDFSPEHSSLKKGESFEDTIKTLLAMKVDGFVIRHPEDKISTKIKELLPANTFYINAGDGNYAHPTQAMLDVFTMKEKFHNLNNLKITILGDVNHSRVIPSQIELLKIYSCLDINYLGPDSLISNKFSPSFSSTSENCLAERDILFILRIQKERFKNTDNLNESDFINEFQVNNNFLTRTGFNGFIMHPGPMNINAEITNEVANNDNSLVLKQVENGLYLRAALLSLIA